MKRTQKLFNLLLPLMVMMQLVAVAQDDNNNGNNNGNFKKYEFSKTKSINKSYNVSNTDKLNINNSFGKVEVHTWDRNEIKVDINIDVSASKEDLAQKIIDGITVSDAQSGKEITFKTSMKGNNTSHGDKSSMKVDYSISMPASNPLRIANEFGATVIPDYKGEVDLVSKFGSLTAGSLSNVRSIDVEFGHASFENIDDGNISIKYSNATFGKVTGNIKLNLEFSTGVKMSIDNGLKGLDVKASYSTLNLKPVGDPSASYTISTSFGSFKNRTSIKFDGDDEDDDKGPKFDHKYSGKSGSGSIPIKINSDFSNIILGEPAQGDMKDGKKSKSRTT
jgi:hypothetical protein